MRLRGLLATNAKLEKEWSNYSVVGLTLAPHLLSGSDMCPHSTTACRAACNMWFSGQRVTPQARAHAIALTRWYINDPESFLAQLDYEVMHYERKALANGQQPYVRPDMASDQGWIDLAEKHPRTTFYGYTKDIARMRRYLAGDLPTNYHLTFSFSEITRHNTAESILSRGGNIAMVLDIDYYPQHASRIGPMPTEHIVNGRPYDVIDGDKHDFRLPWVDGYAKIIGLRLKGTNAAKARARYLRFAQKPSYARSSLAYA